MASCRISEITQHLRTAVLGHDGAGLSDGQLLERFVSCRDEAAVSALVRRHGAMVWGVCRRILWNAADAEDAFQATFLVLIRKASVVRPRELVANWLHGVACQTALKARATAAKRRTRERQVTVMPEPEAPAHFSNGADGQGPDLHQVLDHELSRLPDKYRAAIVLCDLESKTRKEAARQLGVPEGTVASRLVRARTLLAKRLARRGLAVSAGCIAAALTTSSAAAPAAVAASTIKTATLVAAGQAATAGAISANVAALTHGVLTTMLLRKLKIATLILLAIGTLTLAGGFLTHPTGAAQQGQAEQAPIEGQRGKAVDPPGKGDALRREREKFVGTWKWVAAEGHGKKYSERDVLDNLHTKMKWLTDMEGRRRPVLTGTINFFVTYDAEGKWKRRVESDPAFTYLDCDGTSTIDPAKDPKTIDDTVTSVAAGHELARKNDVGAAQKGQVRHGIYQFVNADTYRVSFAAPGKERPTSFATTPESEHVVWVLQRIKKDKDDAKPMEPTAK